MLKIKIETTLAFFTFAFAVSSSSADVRQSFKGRLETTGPASITVAPFIVEKPWRELKIRGGLEQEGYGIRRFHATLGGEKVFQGKHRIRPVDGGVESVWTFSPERPFVPEYLGVSVQLQAAEFADGILSLDGDDEPFFRYGIPIDFRREEVRSLAFVAADDARRVELEFGRPVSLRILYGGEDGVTIRVHVGESICTPGNDVSISCTVRRCGTVAGIGSATGDTVVLEGEDWVPLTVSQKIAEGSALDLSNLRPTGKPAGKFGHVVARGEHFEFEGMPGVPQRFYGVNLCGLANYPETLDDARQIAKTLARIGYNSVRIHHHDALCVDKNDLSAVKLDDAQMEKLDNLVAACIEEGLYISTDLFVSRTRAGISWRSVGIDRDGNMSGDEYKMAVLVHEGARSNLFAFARNFFGHVNRHTGRRLADEPALGWISLVNEGPFEKFYCGSFSSYPGWKEAWASYCGKESAAIPGERLSHEGREFDIFVAEMERRFVERTRTFLREELGIQALVTDGNDTTRIMAAMGGVRGRTLDYVDGHFYVGHPMFIDRMWERPTWFDGENPIKGFMAGAAELTTMRMLGKPFTVSEYNYCGPMRFRGAGGMLAGAEAALQDWAGMWRFAWAHNGNSALHPWTRPAGYFDIAADPLLAVSERVAACLFLRGDLAPLTNTYVVTLPEKMIADPGAPVGKNLIRPWQWVGWFAKTGAALGDRLTDDASSAGDFAAVALKTPDDIRRDLFGDGNIPTKAGGGALDIDPIHGIFSVATPRTCGIFAESGIRQAGPLQIKILSPNQNPANQSRDAAIVFATSLDGESLPQSRRILVAHLTDLQNSGERYADAEKTILKDFGVLPYLVRVGTAEIKMRLAEGVTPTVFALDTAGNRRAEIPSTYDAATGALRFTASVRQSFGGCLCYEITRESENLPPARIIEIQPVPRMDVRYAPRDGGIFGDYWWASRFAEHAFSRRSLHGKQVDVVLLGDSIVHYWEEKHQDSWASFTNGLTVLNLGYAGDKTQNVIWRILHGELDGYEAKVVVIEIGTNNNTNDKSNPADVATGVERIVELVHERQPNAKVILHPIFPRGASAESTQHAAPKVRNEKTNLFLKEFAAENPDVIWLDFNELFLGADGWVSRELMADEIHPTDYGYAVWRNVLQPHVTCAALPIPANKDAPHPRTLFLAGASTLDDHCGDESTYGSWGSSLRPFLREGCAIMNYGRSGRSTTSFIREGWWGKIVEALAPGDFVVIQFGHNDQKLDKPDVATPIPQYRENLRRMAADVRAKGATPVFATPIVRLTYGEDGLLTDAPRLDDWAEAMRETAAEIGVDLVDMRAMTRKAANDAGEAKALTWYAAGDRTHPAVKGARLYASFFLDDVRRRGLPIAGLFVPETTDANPK